MKNKNRGKQLYLPTETYKREVIKCLKNTGTYTKKVDKKTNFDIFGLLNANQFFQETSKFSSKSQFSVFVWLVLICQFLENRTDARNFSSSRKFIDDSEYINDLDLLP